MPLLTVEPCGLSSYRDRVGFRDDELQRLEQYRTSLFGLVAGPGPADLRQPLDWHAGMTVDDVSLADAYPKTVLIIAFHWRDSPSCRFAWHTFLCAVSPDAPTDEALQLADCWLSFMEYVDGIAPMRQHLPCDAVPHSLGASEALAAAD